MNVEVCFLKAIVLTLDSGNRWVFSTSHDQKHGGVDAKTVVKHRQRNPQRPLLGTLGSP